jgi:glycosyltransferase involved in cell wall biosynthesis
MGGRCLAAALTVAAAARFWGVDLIHSNTSTAHFVGSLAGHIAHLPVVWHVRDMQRTSVLEYLASRPTRAVVYVSDATRRRVPLRRVTGVRREVVHNAINADLFAHRARPGAFRSELGVGPGVPLVLMAAQMVPWKGHRTLIRAVGEMGKRFGNVRAAIAGGDRFGEHADYEEELHRLVRELGLRDRVEFLGHRQDMPTLMADSNVVVVPSRGEPFGRVAVEAMSLGKPVIGTEDGGLAEIIEPGRTGLLVPPDAPADLAQALQRLLADGELRHAMGRAGARRVRRHFTVQAHERRIRLLYERILHRDPSGLGART